MTNFQKAYQLLNPAQREAVDAIDGPVMVIAGPGTGKTQVLTTRIANILSKTDTSPRSILALTYTESAATNMRERLVNLIGKSGHYVQIATFHAFCSDVIAEHSEYFPIKNEAEALSDLERYEFLRSIIDETSLEILKPINDPYHNLKDISGRISELKRENISPDKYCELIEAERQTIKQLGLKPSPQKTALKKLAKNEELLIVYQKYQTKLTERQRFDFEDMIRFVIDAFSQHDDLLADYQENLHYFLIDEYQDTNTSQNQVIDLLASYWAPNPNVFVVGDPNQSIFRFQGASVENALSFADKYQDTKIVTLTTGYRCPQPHYDLAHQLISQNNLTKSQLHSPSLNSSRLTILNELDKKIVGQKATEKSIELNLAPSKTAEIINIAQQIEILIKNGAKPSQIAVLYHDNSDAEIIKEVLQKWQLPFSVQSNHDVLSNLYIQQLIAFFRLIDQIDEDDRELDVFPVFALKWLGLDELALMKLAKIANLNQQSLLETLDFGYNPIASTCQKYELFEETFDQLREKLVLIRQLKIDNSNMAFTQWFELAINKSGFLSYLKGLPEYLELIVYLKTLFDQVKNLSQATKNFDLGQFIKAIDLMVAYKISIKSEQIKLTNEAVCLSTVHKAKGQEWKYVFVTGIEDKKWGNRRKNNHIDLPNNIIANLDLEKKDRDEDDRRLFYVAITRAKNRLFLSASKTYLSNNQEKSKAQSIFLSEIKNDQLVLTNENVEISENDLAKLVEPNQTVTTQPESVKKFFAELVRNYQLTVSDLKTYLHDPKEFIQNVLLRVPRAKAPFFAYGTAVHGALEFLYSRYLLKNAFPPLEDLLDSYQFHLKKEILIQNEFERRLKIGQAVLTAYYDNNKSNQPQILALEKKLGGFSHPIIIGDDISIAGRIDRLDWLDKEKKHVKVIDYKTGKQKTDNEIEGRVGLKDYSQRELEVKENIRGHYKRQLLFYKLLLENDHSLNVKVTHGAFEFVEPKDNGKIVTRLFELKDEDVEDLKQLVIEVTKEIRSLKFLESI